MNINIHVYGFIIDCGVSGKITCVNDKILIENLRKEKKTEFEKTVKMPVFALNVWLLT